MEQILDEYPGRDAYLERLFQLFGRPSHCFHPSVYISGASGTGKTAVLLQLLQHFDSISYAMIDCIEFYTAKMYFEGIVNRLHGHTLSVNNNFESFASCDSAEDFIEALSTLNAQRSYVVILKHFDRLHEIDSNILPIMMRLNVFVPQINISCILIGTQIQRNFIGKIGLVPTINVHCEQYGKMDLLQILSKRVENLKRMMIQTIKDDTSIDNRKDDGRGKQKLQQRLMAFDKLDERFYMAYFNQLLDVFFPICRNAKELIYLSNANFAIYCRPVIDGEIQSTDLRKLWKNMDIPFKLAMNTIYCRVEQKNHLNQLAQQAKEMEQSGTVASSTKAEVQKLELPHYTKYLLIAAYLASHNDAKIDKRLFVKNHGKQKKRLQNVRAKATVSEKFSTQIGPKSFTIDRLMAIFYAINVNKVPVTSDLMMQISNLVRLKYLAFVSGESNIMDGTARLQCNVTLNFIAMIGKQVGFNVRQYLSDFM